MYASLRSIGAYIPSKKLENADFEKMVDTSDEWIVQRTGIKTRYIADASQATSDLAYEAAKIAIERARIAPEKIDAIVCATITPDYFCMPSTACVVADKLGIKGAMAFDISAACSGFVYALSIAKSFIESGMHQNVLIIGAEKMSSIVDYEDRTTSILFGDGAGAAIITATDDKTRAILDVKTASDGEYQDFLITEACGSRNGCSQEVLDKKMHFLKMKGNETFKLAVNTLTQDVFDILQENHICAEDIDWFVPHQANYRIINAVSKKLGMSEEHVVLTVGEYGNTSAASIPMALNRWYEKGEIKKGQLLLLDTFGGGLTWGSALLYFNGD